MDLKYIIMDFIRTKNLQQWVNNRYKENGSVIVPRKYFTHLVTREGNKVKIPSLMSAIVQTYEEYDSSDIKSTDILVDIGANVGGFSLQFGRKVRGLVCVEPLFHRELRENIETNNIPGTVLVGGLGDGKGYTIEFDGRKEAIPTYTFSEIKKIAGGCDFLKCDCEGFEWFIKPEELEGVRRIEMEIHNYNPSGNDPNELIGYLNANYNVSLIDSVRRVPLKSLNIKWKNHIDWTCLLHAWKK
jgi:hypothetical protein